MPTIADPYADLDTLMFLLANRRRRMIIRYLMDQSSVSLSTLADAIANVEDNSDSRAVYVNLYQDHCPKLDSANVVEYDSQAKTVTHGSQFSDAAAVLDCADQLG